MLFALAAAPLAGAVGAAIDFNNASRIRWAIQHAADAAVLAAARTPAATEQEQEARSAFADDVFRANFSARPHGDIEHLDLVDLGDNGLRYEARVRSPTTLLGIFGVSHLTARGFAEAHQATAVDVKREFVVAFDVTNSMFFSPPEFQQAVATMQDFVDRMFAGASGDDVTGTVMPFSDRVRLPAALGPGYPSAWTTGAQPGSWRGCLDVRPEPAPGQPDRLTDAPPRGPGSIKFQWFSDTTKTAPGGSSYTFGCHANPGVFASRDVAALRGRLADMGLGGTGRMDEAMAWAWRVLSPRWTGEWGLSGYPGGYDNPSDPNDGNIQKIAVLVSDGRTEAYRYEVTPPGAAASVYGWNMGSQRGFENLEAVCTAMKSAGVHVYVVQLAGNANATAHFQRCASADSHFLVTGIAGFVSAFREVGDRTEQLRLTR